ncbi:hypothetical protein BpHYR1_018530 [Brachionus plicatilis]|uniref:Uncharacterized protein n=1 Tax=Brachionus plicatilis TaxID=10195 RepID=A0A3M7RSQ6_BRAPC|nr:hypothetical protein BpHYR1_018530 [Brachionus plicatilis]
MDDPYLDGFIETINSKTNKILNNDNNISLELLSYTSVPNLQRSQVYSERNLFGSNKRPATASFSQ